MSAAQASMDSMVLQRPTSLLETLDLLLEKGVVVDGQVLLSVADIDLICLGLKLVLSSAETLRIHHSFGQDRFVQVPYSLEREKPLGHASTAPARESPASSLARISEGQKPGILKGSPLNPKLNLDPKKVEKGLAKLVLTIVELIRRLLEKQAVRRMEGGSLTQDQTERLGEAFRQLEEKTDELIKFFGLTREELNLDLGLGTLM